MTRSAEQAINECLAKILKEAKQPGAVTPNTSAQHSLMNSK
ncbi:hypothetical protein [Alicyclobacillus fastidiosus]|uniref:Uncharacterized protein n=1 Tax=Alicyclobacillus fastidiosus TaxID=392011 RepID=A0ABV5AM75_9BACL|nr:hypothetical protein [Alicyclobacillus fastidiosus]WEH08210.1 hypothetical protein PYS47_16010 [Alicyclobacillus fastidiosus]